MPTTSANPTTELNAPPASTSVAVAEDFSVTIVNIFEALQKGKFPSNGQIDAIFTRIQSSSEMKTIEPLLSPQGQCLWHYIQAALDTIRQANRAINSRESLQSMIYYLNQADPLGKPLPWLFVILDD
ncbi:hypothetical protein BATDEDRAFT_85783 [Batrachochytrium dendrobatidis JAM81]|uniref:HAM1-like N-terminal domain-containing protein n=1 Tax=Batrachochytrium dendrobatidis (strain JAM81 / FGSC 10211) TaxID=684364 RepID=F4NU33_BATDJ|nr:uncharacterized protein BATDEDRAFT_85783 [Batrachochytrium dendrobatidis JAM81]EGF83160.1 hypothetical protein BATDEDRAFT_85783 [Batrachochytrium dendrobatidis JAM81]|eukprot:XP_006675999.1 hypothetical protein BATDEDRAFT_85783 [Batrachochytrium dendrobatidis JAM81]